MGWLQDTAQLAQASAPLVGAIGDFIQSGETNKQAHENRLQNLEIQKHIWNREDSAIQRRVNDLKASGLSPVLAAGSAAQTGAPIQLGNIPAAENVTQSLAKGTAQMLGARQQMANLAATEAGQKLTESQVEKTEAETLNTLTDVGQKQQKFDVDFQKAVEEFRRLQVLRGIDNFELNQMNKGPLGMHRYSQYNTNANMLKSAAGELLDLAKDKWLPKTTHQEKSGGGKPKTTTTIKTGR